jgi:hypothetical protein
MSDEERELAAIDTGYTAELSGMFQTMFINADTDGVEIAGARFEKGLKILRNTRQKAIEIVKTQ